MAEHKRKADFMSGYRHYDPESEGFGNSNQWKKQFQNRMSQEEAEEVIEDDDPWSILGVARNATFEEIRKAFYAKAMHWHPDVSHEPVESATKMMQKINAAYSLLQYIGKN